MQRKKQTDDLINRQETIDALDNIKIPRNASWYPYYQQALTAMSRLPSAYPETDSFCTDCKEYDQERHFCPRFDRVIKRTVEEMGIIHCKDCSNWIPGYITDQDDLIPPKCGKYQQMVGHSSDDYCSLAERREK